MTQEDKELLLQDLCARLPYGTIGEYSWKKREPRNKELTGDLYDELESSWSSTEDSEFIPYLRPMSSITEEEKEEIKPLFSKFTDEFGKRVLVVRQNKMALYQDWLNKNMFDYRGLIPMGLAIEVTEENNPYKE